MTLSSLPRLTAYLGWLCWIGKEREVLAEGGSGGGGSDGFTLVSGRSRDPAKHLKVARSGPRTENSVSRKTKQLNKTDLIHRGCD